MCHKTFIMLLFVPTGSVIKGWDVGVATMKRGELAKFTITSEYAYGKKGAPPKIPADTTLTFEVELFDWKGTQFADFFSFAVSSLIKSNLNEHQSNPNHWDIVCFSIGKMAVLWLPEITEKL